MRRRREAAAIEASRGWAVLHTSEATAHARFARFCVTKSPLSLLFLRAAAAIEESSVRSWNASSDTAHAVFAMSCPQNAVIFRIADDDIAARRGASGPGSTANAQGVHAQFGATFSDRGRMAADASAGRRGRSGNVHTEKDHAVFAIPCGCHAGGRRPPCPRRAAAAAPSTSRAMGLIAADEIASISGATVKGLCAKAHAIVDKICDR